MAKCLFLISFTSSSQSAFLTKSLTLGTLLSTAVRAVAVAKLVTLDTSY